VQGHDHEAELLRVGALFKKRRERQIRDRLAESATKATGPALMLAAMLEETEPADLISQAVAQFLV